uniref:Elongator complex protein 2 n=1 Tax=Elaeophora elaphi TaxID=1147741 RepID=A0A0R3S0Y0_9BILA
MGTNAIYKEVSECKIGITFMGTGCRRCTKCLAWSKVINVVVFASAGNICFVIPRQNNRCIAIENAVKAHDSPITCLRFVSWYHCNTFGLDYLITGAADGTVRLWAVRIWDKTVVAKLINDIGSVATGKKSSPVNCCAGSVFSETNKDIIIVTYAIPNGLLVAEQITVDRVSLEGSERQSYERITFQPAFIVSLAVHIISSDDILFVLGTTSSNVEVICSKFAYISSQLRKVATLQGHTDWIGSIDIRAYGKDIWVASGGQESIRLWRFNLLQDSEVCTDYDSQLKAQFTLFNKETKADTCTVNITLEGVLNAHEDWICSVEWHCSKLQLLSASNDKTLIIWESSEADDGLWFDSVRVGDVGGQAAGFFGACFSPDGYTILAYSYFGGFYSWQAEKDNSSYWKSVSTFGGHSGEVKDITWDPTGSYLLSCSYDQTTRCYAPSVNHGVISEIARPQMHGYDLTCIASISSSRFVSGADEKILRVFAVPRNFVEILNTVSKYDCQKLFPDSAQIAGHSAAIPALSLSNKIINIQEKESLAARKTMNREGFFMEGLPVEECLMQDTLWPEIHKLYGHGFELFTVASNHSGTLIASACKASRIENAVIIIWDTAKWRRLCELQCHKLTVSQLAFSNNDSFLLSVSRDRTFAISTRSPEDPFDWKILLSSEQKYSKVHSRIIWCCAWAPNDKYFVTGARDKKLCLWRFNETDIQLVAERKHLHAITAVDFAPKLWNKHYILAVGFENGEIEIEKWNLDESDMSNSDKCLKRWLAHSETINRLKFRPKEGSWLNNNNENNHVWELASVSNDHSVIVHQLSLL